MLPSHKQQRNYLMPLAFIDESLVNVVRCTTVPDTGAIRTLNGDNLQNQTRFSNRSTTKNCTVTSKGSMLSKLNAQRNMEPTRDPQKTTLMSSMGIVYKSSV